MGSVLKNRVAAIFCLGFVATSLVVSCGTSEPEKQIVPESDYPSDLDDGFQPGGGKMPTYVPTQDGYETLQPSE